MTNLPVSNLSLQQHRSFMDEHSSLQRAFASNQSLQRFGEQEGFHVGHSAQGYIKSSLLIAVD